MYYAASWEQRHRLWLCGREVSIGGGCGDEIGAAPALQCERYVTLTGEVMLRVAEHTRRVWTSQLFTLPPPPLNTFSANELEHHPIIIYNNIGATAASVELRGSGALRESLLIGSPQLGPHVRAAMQSQRRPRPDVS
jgi:hypothetical protein